MHSIPISKVARYQECLKSLVYLPQTEHHNSHSTSKERTFWGSEGLINFKGRNFEVRVGVRGLVGMVRVRSWVMHYESSHKDISTIVCVCVVDR